jgi:hypothetical protein
MARVLRGVPTGSGSQALTTSEVPGALLGGIDASLSQSWNHIVVLSAFGSFSFEKENATVVTNTLVELAKFIERNIT